MLIESGLSHEIVLRPMKAHHCHQCLAPYVLWASMLPLPSLCRSHSYLGDTYLTHSKGGYHRRRRRFISPSTFVLLVFLHNSTLDIMLDRISYRSSTSIRWKRHRSLPCFPLLLAIILTYKEIYKSRYCYQILPLFRAVLLFNVQVV